MTTSRFDYSLRLTLPPSAVVDGTSRPSIKVKLQFGDKFDSCVVDVLCFYDPLFVALSNPRYIGYNTNGLFK